MGDNDEPAKCGPIAQLQTYFETVSWMCYVYHLKFTLVPCVICRCLPATIIPHWLPTMIQLSKFEVIASKNLGDHLMAVNGSTPEKLGQVGKGEQDTMLFFLIVI